jgi:2-polyprenyl-3-methyl-5-hydroxy-6-metoxy-1,4-benzoquinol methylase
MDYRLHQRGRAALAFIADLGAATNRLRPRLDDELQSHGLSETTLADNLDTRLRQVDSALAGSPVARAYAALSEWNSTQHGRIARDAFDEIRDQLTPKLADLQRSGATTLETPPGVEWPAYSGRHWIHRTTGGWDGHPYQGFIHGELIHREYVARVFPGDIFQQRREALGVLPQRDYQRIMEFGTSSGHYTTQIAHVYPKAEIWGCDTSRTMLEQAQRYGNEHGLAWHLLHAPAESTGQLAETFDLVTSYIVLHEVPAAAIDSQLVEAFRLLRPGGDVLFCDVARYAASSKAAVRWAEYGALHGGEPFWRESAQVDLGAAAQAAGFVKVRSEGLGKLQHPWIVYGHKPD